MFLEACPPHTGPALTSVALTVPASHATCPGPWGSRLGVHGLVPQSDHEFLSVRFPLREFSLYRIQMKGAGHFENASNEYSLYGRKHSIKVLLRPVSHALLE